jgi:mannose-6-phosphate isomerase-like protein (cupin superfamily)
LFEKAFNYPMASAYRVEKWTQDDPPNPVTLQRTLTEEGYGVFQWSDQPGVTYGPHHHGEDQSHWIISGSLELTVEGAGVFVLEPGDRDFMPAGTEHKARVIGEEPVLYLIGAKT